MTSTPPSQSFSSPPRPRELDSGPLSEGKELTFERALDGGRRGPGSVGTPAGGLCCPLAGSLWTTQRRGRSCRVSASGFSSFVFWGGVNLAFRGDQGWRPPLYALDHPTSSTSPCANFEDRAFQVAEGGSLGRAAGAARSGESVREPESLGQGSADSRSPSFLKPPRPSFGGNITPRAIFRERAVPFECGFSFSFPTPSPPSPSPFFFQIAVCL